MIIEAEASATTLQSPRPGNSLDGENQVNSDQEYMQINPATKLRNWEISREQVHVVKTIGKGAFSQVAKAMTWNINGIKGLTIVAVKMLKGMRNKVHNCVYRRWAKSRGKEWERVCIDVLLQLKLS